MLVLLQLIFIYNVVFSAVLPGNFADVNSRPTMIFTQPRTETKPIARGETEEMLGSDVISSSSLTFNTPVAPEQIRFKVNSEETVQYPLANSVQYASSNSDIIGGSVFSDGAGIHVHPRYSAPFQEFEQERPRGYQVQVWPPAQRGLSPKFNTIDGNIYSTTPRMASRIVENPSFNDFLNPPGTAPESMIPGTRYLPSQLAMIPSMESRGSFGNAAETRSKSVSTNTQFSGLGRVLPRRPAADSKGNPPQNARGLGRVVFPERDHSSELVYFTLGRALGQLNNQNNNSDVSNKVLEKLIGIAAPDLSPTKPPTKSALSPWEEAWEKQTALQKQKFRENFELEKQWRQQWQKAQKQSSLWRQWAQPKLTSSLWRQPPPWAHPQNPFGLRGNNLWRQQPGNNWGAAPFPPPGIGSDINSRSFFWMNDLEKENAVQQSTPWWYDLLKGKREEEQEG